MKVALHRNNLRKAGDSVMHAVSPPSQKLPHYTLNQLVAQCKPRVARTKEEREWLDDKPLGRERL